MESRRPQSQDDALLKQLGLATSEMLDEIDESVERDRFSRLLIRVLDSKPFFGTMVMQMQVHTGRDALRYTKTACVFVSLKDMSLHLAMNPFFLQALERVETVRGEGLPDAQTERDLLGRGFWVWSMGEPPDYLHQVIKDHDIPWKDPDGWLAIKLDLDYQISLLIHEFRHILKRHLEADKEMFPDGQLLNLAMDLSVNQGLPHLPPGGITLHTWEPWGLELDPNQSYAVYYEKLKKFFGELPRGKKPKKKGDKKKNRAQGIAPGTLISLSDGRALPIEKLDVGMKVWTLDVTGNKVPRTIWHLRRKFASDAETEARLPTSMFDLRFKSGRRLRRVSGRMKVVIPAANGPVPATTGAPSSHRPGPSIVHPGDRVFVETPSGYSVDLLERIDKVPTQADEELYQLGVTTTGDAISGFFANGVFVLGLRVPGEKKGGKPGEDSEEKPPSEDDDDTVSSPNPPGHLWSEGDEVLLKDGRRGVIVEASDPDEAGVQQLRVEVKDREPS